MSESRTGTRVVFRNIGFRKSGAEWIVGRRDTGDFIAVGSEGERVIRLLGAGVSVQDARRSLLGETGRDFDVMEFVRGLIAVGLVHTLDGRDVSPRQSPPETLPRVRPRHVRWLLYPLVQYALVALFLAGFVVAVLRPDVMPDWNDLIWSQHGTLVLIGQVILAWLLILLHELAHLLTARADGVPGRIRLGTRLQFLVAQTDISGVWLSERRIRISVYLAGVVLDGAICGGCLLAVAAFGPHELLSIVILNTLIPLLIEFMVFMRTDIYFVLQDLTNCRNMYADATRYLRYLCRRVAGRTVESPLRGFRLAERRTLQTYAVVLVVGTVASIALALSIAVNVTLPLAARAASQLFLSSGWLDRADAVTTLLIIGGFTLLWAWTWWRRHGPNVRRLLARYARL